MGTQCMHPAPPIHRCETAGYFFLSHVLAQWEKFEADATQRRAEGAAVVALLFPFTDFFADAPQPLFGGGSFEADMQMVRAGMPKGFT